MKSLFNNLSVLLVSYNPFCLAFYPINTHDYQLTADYSGQNFFDNFKFYSEKDPTNGHVQYVDMTTANSTALAGFLADATNGTTHQRPVYLGVDSTKITPFGRPSTRVYSTQTFNHSLIIADIMHMPAPVCGTWPAYWLLGTAATWPAAGEIDILENVHAASQNKYTLHTTAGIKVANYTGRGQAGLLETSDCNVASPNQPKNTGCSISDCPYTPSYGDVFNNNAGGVFATLIDHAGVRIWFFPRGNIPMDILMGHPNPPSRSMVGPGNDSTWPQPNAKFEGPGNKFDDHFRDLQVVFNTAFCGDWAGKTWEQSGCAKDTGVATCEEFVTGRPEEFVDVWWGVNSVRVYEVGVGSGRVSARGIDGGHDNGSGKKHKRQHTRGHRRDL